MLNENHVTETVVSTHQKTNTFPKAGGIPAILDNSGRGSKANYMLCDSPICGIPAIPIIILCASHSWLLQPVIFLQSTKKRFQEQLYKVSKVFKRK